MRTTGVESSDTQQCNVYNSTVRLAQLKKVELFNRATISLEKINEVMLYENFNGVSDVRYILSRYI